jgi:hypothetical protein
VTLSVEQKGGGWVLMDVPHQHLKDVQLGPDGEVLVRSHEGFSAHFGGDLRGFTVTSPRPPVQLSLNDRFTLSD